MPVLEKGKVVTWKGHCITCGYCYGNEVGEEGYNRVYEAIHDHANQAGYGHFVDGPYDVMKKRGECAYCGSAEETCKHCGGPR